ncbi:hypothetical protein [Peribacillus butanolivorans]|uniref:hypothetical protein n=1 Tax=Peribacillus butanolivorans TaxID=421767 RepID=UPI00380A77CE
MKRFLKEENVNNLMKNSKEHPPITRACGTMDMHNKLLKESEEYRKEREKIESMTEEYIKSRNK